MWTIGRIVGAPLAVERAIHFGCLIIIKSEVISCCCYHVTWKGDGRSKLTFIVLRDSNVEKLL